MGIDRFLLNSKLQIHWTKEYLPSYRGSHRPTAVIYALSPILLLILRLVIPFLSFTLPLPQRSPQESSSTPTTLDPIFSLNRYLFLNRKFCLDFVEDAIKLSEDSIELSIKQLKVIYNYLGKKLGIRDQSKREKVEAHRLAVICTGPTYIMPFQKGPGLRTKQGTTVQRRCTCCTRGACQCRLEMLGKKTAAKAVSSQNNIYQEKSLRTDIYDVIASLKQYYLRRRGSHRRNKVLFVEGNKSNFLVYGGYTQILRHLAFQRHLDSSIIHIIGLPRRGSVRVARLR